MKKICALIVLLAAATFILIGCSNSGLYKDGSYTGISRGVSSDIKVSVEVKKGKIDSIKILEHNETENLIDAVNDNIIPEIIKKQKTEGIDAVSGATGSSKGVIAAVDDALAKAKK